MTIDACLLFSSVEPRLLPFARAEYQPERKYVAFRTGACYVYPLPNTFYSPSVVSSEFALRPMHCFISSHKPAGGVFGLVSEWMFRVPPHCNAPMNTSPAHMSILPPGLCFGDASNCQQMWGPGPSLLTADREACQIKRYMGNKTGQAGFAFKFHQLPLEGHHFALGIHPSATSESHSQYQRYITHIFKYK